MPVFHFCNDIFVRKAINGIIAEKLGIESSNALIRHSFTRRAPENFTKYKGQPMTTLKNTYCQL
jgi:hypothetical protein